jgi:hypothetical protein
MIADRWGVTGAETARRYPCDEFVTAPSLQLWRGVTANAAPEHVWPWVTQIRAAPYSYDLIDNLGRRSPRSLLGLAEPIVGEHFTTALGGRRLGRILSLEPQRQLTATIMGTVMSYVLEPIAHGEQTRLLLKIVAAGTQFTTPVLALGDLIMARRQLLNLAALAETAAPNAPAGPAPVV